MDQSFLTAPHSLSQSSTSFIASTNQGIRHLLLVAYLFLELFYYVDILIRITSLLKIKLIYFIMFISYKLRRKEIINYKVVLKTLLFRA